MISWESQTKCSTLAKIDKNRSCHVTLILKLTRWMISKIGAHTKNNRLFKKYWIKFFTLFKSLREELIASDEPKINLDELELSPKS